MYSMVTFVKRVCIFLHVHKEGIERKTEELVTGGLGKGPWWQEDGGGREPLILNHENILPIQ